MEFTYNVPEFTDFTHNCSNENPEDVEAYFELEHEHIDNINNGFATEEIVCNSTFEEGDDCQVIEEKDPLDIGIKRSSSVGDLYNKVYRERKERRTQFKNATSRNMSMTKSYLNRSKSTHSLIEQNKKFISVAEAINTYHMKTPDRFHTRSHALKPDIKSSLLLTHATVPISPFLSTKQRARVTNVLSQNERENKEVEEMLKFKIKANPLNPKILAGPLKPKSVVPKKPTVPQPFKITEVAKRVPVTPVQTIPQFHAQPLPKYIRERSACKSATPIVRAQAPILAKRNETKKKLEFKVTDDKPLKPTTPKPFSFAERDKDLLARKDKALKELLEQEKKNREFHANPLPKYISANEGGSVTLYSKNSSNSLKYSSTDNVNQSVFKAKPAKVLHMKPFEPKKDPRPLIEIAQFQLSTEYRAKERDAFQQKMKERQEWLEHFRLTKEEQKLQKEEEEIRMLRKQTEYKAQPIRKYKQVETIVQKELTVPISPNFRSNRNKENIST